MNVYYNNNIGKLKKINGACVFLSTVSFLAGKFATREQMLLAKPINNFLRKWGACLFWAPVFL